MRRLLVLCGAVLFVDTMFYGAIAPLLPYYEDRLGISKAAAGVLAGAYPAGTLTFALLGGYLAASIGPKRTVILGLLVQGAATLAFGFADDILLLDAARFVQGAAGTLMWAGALGWLLGEGPRERRGEIIGTAIAAAIAGQVLGPGLGGLAAATAPAAVFGVVALASVVLAVMASRQPAGEPPGAPPFAAVRVALRTRSVVVAMWLLIIPSLMAGVVEVLAPLRLSDLGAGTAVVGAVFLVAAAIEGLFSRSIGRLADRRGRLLPLRIGLAAGAVLHLALPIPEAVAVLSVVVVAFWTGLAFFWAPAQALVADKAEATGLPVEFFMGFSNLAWGGGQVIGAAGGGALAAATADAVSYGVLAVVCLGTLALLSTAWGRSAGLDVRPEQPAGAP